MLLELTQPNRYVFHFTSAKTLLTQILPQKQLRFSPLGLTNDPRETQERIFAISGGRSIDDDSWCDEMVELTAEASKILRQKYVVLCTTRNDSALCRKTVFGIGYSHARMWAQYAENHKGSCIVLEREALNKEICQVFGAENVYQGPVRYTDGPLKEDLGAFQLSYNSIEEYGLDKTLEDHVNRHFDSIFLRKYRDWENEWEYRWIIKSKSNDYEFVSIVDAIKAVFASIEFPNECLSNLKRECENLKIYGGEIKWPNGYPSLWKSTIFNPS
jgi:hypothetical protein